jgi:FPC/CPF motif-containing protein YcgG
MKTSDRVFIPGTKRPESAAIHETIRSFISQANYPCVAAIRSVGRSEYIVGIYDEFGSDTHWQQLRADLCDYILTQRRTQSRYVSFWALFTTHPSMPDNEIQFEDKLWRELSLLSSEEDRPLDWGTHTSDPNDPGFCVSLMGEKLFVVGLHPQSSRVARRLSRQALVFNTLSQFDQFEKDGTYTTLVHTIRRRELNFQGSINPMVQAHGDVWESIQYSGRDNPDSWTCPFQFMKRENKPR